MADDILKVTQADRDAVSGQQTNLMTAPFKTLARSGKQFFTDLTAPILHPIKTATTLAGLSHSLINLIRPGEQGNEQLARDVGAFFKKRYGSLDAIKETALTDPFGFLADVSILFTGGGMLAARGGGVLAKAGSVAKRVGKGIDPVSQTINLARATTIPQRLGKGVGYGASQIVGALTTKGRVPLQTAYGAGKTGGIKGQTFRESLTGKSPLDTLQIVIDEFKRIRQEKYAAFAESKEGLKLANKKLTPAQIRKLSDSLDDLPNQFKDPFGGWTINTANQNVIQQIITLKNQFLKNKKAHNALGLDTLKRRIDDLYVVDKTSQTPRIITQSRNIVKKNITDVAPEYTTVMKQFEDAANFLKEAERQLGLGKNANPDLILNKMRSVFREEGGTRYPTRERVVQQLDETGELSLPERLSGEALNPVLPSVIGKAGGFGVLGLAYGVNPKFAALLPFMSPRLMGEAAYYGGKLSPHAKRILPEALRAERTLQQTEEDVY